VVDLRELCDGSVRNWGTSTVKNQCFEEFVDLAPPQNYAVLCIMFRCFADSHG
jgi:hypothetical protein